MSQPLWLMMGTAFRFQTPAMARAAAPPPTLLLTAKHTFAPWDFAKDASQLKIPKEFQKLRFVIGRLYSTDDAGNAVGASAVGLRLLAQHPNLDVALLAVEAQTPSRATAGPSAAQLFADEPLRLCAAPYAAGSDGIFVGFRGLGRLGELDTLDPSLLQRLPPHERDALLKELQSVEGKQTRATTSVAVLDAKGLCRGVGDLATCYHGMSGCPLLTTSGECAGVLYGHHPDAPGCVGYTPCPDFSQWLDGEVERVMQRQETPPLRHSG